MVRLAKLNRGLLRLCDPPQMELFGFVLRGAIETAVNLRYLIEQADAATYDAFVRDSLRLEKELHDRIKAKVEARGGMVMPMEHGMLVSVGARVGSMDGSRLWVWKGCMEQLFGVHSNYAHGAWQELYEHHLVALEDGSFLPQPASEGLSASPLFVAVDVIASASVSYLRASAPECMDRDILEGRISICGDNAVRIRHIYRRFRGMPEGI
jgi:hypothetical protein